MFICESVTHKTVDILPSPHNTVLLNVRRFWTNRLNVLHLHVMHKIYINIHPFFFCCVRCRCFQIVWFDFKQQKHPASSNIKKKHILSVLRHFGTEMGRPWEKKNFGLQRTMLNLKICQKIDYRCLWRFGYFDPRIPA